MTGGRPEYLPVLIAAVEALLDPDAFGDQMQSTSAGTYPVVIVNGPIAKQIRLNSGFGCLGPDPQHTAGARIGRALRQMQQNLGGAHAGSGTMAPWGAMRFTNAVFAEDEDNLPDGWEPIGASRHGFAPATNCLSFFWATGATNIVRRGAKTEGHETDAVQGLRRIAGFMAAPSAHYADSYEGTPGAVLLTSTVAHQLVDAGWTQERIQQFLWENSRIPLEEIQQNGVVAWIPAHGGAVVQNTMQLDPWPITAEPKNILLVVAGGHHPTHAFWMQALARNVIAREVATPPNFDQLLARADRDLGCGADACAI